MTTIQKIENQRTINMEEAITAELRGLSTDEKPVKIAGKKVDNGSVFVEIDTGKFYLFDFDNQEWKEV